MPIAEFEILRVTGMVKAEGYTVPKGTCGTVLAVYDKGSAYAVEIAELPGRTEVITLRADQVERTH
jgi:Domain of unknown function (DUF4926)